MPFLGSQEPTRWRPPPAASSALREGGWAGRAFCSYLGLRPVVPDAPKHPVEAYEALKHRCLPSLSRLKPILVGLQPDGRWHQPRLYPTGLLRVAGRRAEWWQAALEVFPQRRDAGPCGMGQAPLDSAVSQRHSRRWL